MRGHEFVVRQMASLAVAGCFAGQAASLAAAPEPAPATQAADTARDEVAPGVDAGLIAEVLRDRIPLSAARVSVRWGRETAVLHGEGFGFFGHDTQFSISAEQVRDVLRRFDEADFLAMPDRVGGGAPPVGPIRQGGPIRRQPPEVLMGEVGLTIDGRTKSVVQIGGGEQSQPLAKLAGDVLALAREAARTGLRVPNFAEGLAMLADGRLRPEALSVIVQRNYQGSASPEKAGFLLRLEGAAVTARRNSAGKGLGPEHRLVLSDDEAKQLATLIAEADFAALPVNLHASAHTDFIVRVFRFNKGVQARPNFAKIAPDTHGEKQRAFDRLFAEFEKLNERVLKDGAPVE
ncbi:MAG: hypothetical protein WD069_11645 [Planctomycetales bacterium]